MFLAQVQARPAGGAALDQVLLATGMALVATALLALLVVRHVKGGGTVLDRAARLARRGAGLPGWAALPSAVAGLSLVVALVGMYWDIALHIGQGRDEGPLANPAHYLILAGLYGVFAAGVLALALARGRPTGPSAVRLAADWHVPVGGLLMTAAAVFALIGFPLDDVWHRLFGQDVTLWGPTHLMLIGGAGLSLVGHAVLLMEGVRARRAEAGVRGAARPRGERGMAQALALLRGVSLMGGLLIGLSTFQAEFDFGVPQFRLVFGPLLVAVAAGVALVAARLWIGPGAAVGAALFFLAVRGAVGAFVGLTGEAVPALPLYLGAALCVELAAFVLARRGAGPLALGVVAGVLIGTVGLASEWAWAALVMPLAWPGAILAEALVLAVLGGVAGGVLGGLLGAALRGELPRPAVARPVTAAALTAIAALVANGLWTDQGAPARAITTLDDGRLEVTFAPASAAEDAAWVTATSWQGDGLVVEPLDRVGPGRFRSTRALPVDGGWKTLVRVHKDRALRAVPVYLPADPAIPVGGVPAVPRAERAVVDETALLQRERRLDAPGWLWATASLVVLAIAVVFVALLCWGLGRVARRHPRPGPAPPIPAGGAGEEARVRVGA